MALVVVRTHSWGACDMLKRKTFTPIVMRVSSAAGVEVAGPRVAMILVRRMVDRGVWLGAGRAMALCRIISP